MAISDVEAVLKFLRKNGFSQVESALKEDIFDKSTELGSLDFETFLFPMIPPPPPIRIPVTFRQSEGLDGIDDSSSSSLEEFVSMGSSTTDFCSSEFTNPYGVDSAAQGNSVASSEHLSEFGTARDYHDFDMQTNVHWCDEKDEGCFMTPCFDGSAYFGCSTEDKFVMSFETERQSVNPFGSDCKSEGFEPTGTNYLDKPCLLNITSMGDLNEVPVTDYYHLDENIHPEGSVIQESRNCAVYSCSVPPCECCAGTEGFYGRDPANYSSKESNLYVKVVGEIPIGRDSKGEINEKSSANDLIGEFNSISNLYIESTGKDFQPNENDSHEDEHGEVIGESHQPEATVNEEEGVIADELPIFQTQEEYEVFDLKIIHRKNRTGFEENKELPIVLNTVIAGRYYVTEYLGSAAFSRVVQAHDLHTGLDVCLKIIKNDKDFFDQSLDEIKLLKLVNQYDPADERHILRLYDYFYHHEHLFIVCELLRANLYEFQKFNQESGAEPYFTLTRLQVIMRQCLEALEYLHGLGIIHCDLKPENILIKSYKRCEIKIIDLGSSCFQMDHLCLYVQSRSYRAPEVILGLPYDHKIDIWSLGCILAELFSGEVLFPNDAIVVLLARMIGLLGPIDLEMLLKGQETEKYFTKEHDLYYINEETNEVEYIMPEESSLEHHLQVWDILFIDFLRYLLEFNPQRRPTAKEALEHPWLSHLY